jgi:hypothetical protein
MKKQQMSHASSEGGEGPPAIAELLSSWTDLDSLTDVIDYRVAVDANPDTQWTLRDVKAFFEVSNSESRNVILCTHLLCAFLPRVVEEANLARQNNTELARYINIDPMWFGRRMLGKRGVVYLCPCINVHIPNLVSRRTSSERTKVIITITQNPYPSMPLPPFTPRHLPFINCGQTPS